LKTTSGASTGWFPDGQLNSGPGVAKSEIEPARRRPVGEQTTMRRSSRDLGSAILPRCSNSSSSSSTHSSPPSAAVSASSWTTCSSASSSRLPSVPSVVDAFELGTSCFGSTFGGCTRNGNTTCSWSGPRAVLGWHRRGWRLFWRWRPGRGLGPPQLNPEVRQLIGCWWPGRPSGCRWC